MNKITITQAIDNCLQMFNADKTDTRKYSNQLWRGELAQNSAILLELWENSSVLPNFLTFVLNFHEFFFNILFS